MAPRSGARINNYHSNKSQLVGHAAARQAPAWKASNLPQGSAGPSQKDSGSKILLSNLPPDVSEDEIIDLMKKTIGPVNMTQSFMVYNMKGFPKGVTVVAFMRAGDAAKARERYDGKVIDGKRAIKLELIVDQVEQPAPRPPTAPKATLVERMGPQPQNQNIPPPPTRPAAQRQSMKAQGTKAQGMNGHIQQQTPRARAPGSLPVITEAPRRVRQKKGPKRVKKSLADLDREMEEYIAARPDDDQFQNVHF